jgi:hypothetical protein
MLRIIVRKLMIGLMVSVPLQACGQTLPNECKWGNSKQLPPQAEHFLTPFFANSRQVYTLPNYADTKRYYEARLAANPKLGKLPTIGTGQYRIVPPKDLYPIFNSSGSFVKFRRLAFLNVIKAGKMEEFGDFESIDPYSIDYSVFSWVLYASKDDPDVLLKRMLSRISIYQKGLKYEYYKNENCRGVAAYDGDILRSLNVVYNTKGTHPQKHWMKGENCSEYFHATLAGARNYVKYDYVESMVKPKWKIHWGFHGYLHEYDEFQNLMLRSQGKRYEEICSEVVQMIEKSKER